MNYDIHGPRHAKTCLRAYADSEGPDNPSHPHGLIRAFAVRCQNQNVSMESKCPEDTAHAWDEFLRFAHVRLARLNYFHRTYLKMYYLNGTYLQKYH